MSEATELAAKGVPITLADGTPVTLRFTFGSIAALEETFGSLPAAQQKLAAEARALGQGAASSSLYGTLIDALCPGLLHVRVKDPDTGARVRLGRHRDLVGDLLDPTRAREYTSAWALGMREAFGELYARAIDTSADPRVAQETVTTAAPVVVLSPGPSGTTSPSSSRPARTASSGA